MLSLNCKNVQYVKIYISCNLEVNPITILELLPFFHQIFKILMLFVIYIKNYMGMHTCSFC